MTPETIPAQPPPEAASETRLLTVVLVYAAFASLWILGSDWLVGRLFSDPATITLVSTLKGWLFVIVTSLLLWALLRSILTVPRDRPIGAQSPGNRRPTIPLVLLAIATLLLTITGIVRTVIDHRDKQVARLQAIVGLQSREIVDWLTERQADADFVRSSSYFAREYRRWQFSGNADSGKKLQQRLEQLRVSHGVSAIDILDERGDFLWGSAGAEPGFASELRDAVRQAAADRQVRRIGPYRDPAGVPRMDFVVPVAEAGAHVPVILMRTDPAAWLYPALRSWPVPSRTGETLLVRRDGDQVAYLNELRYTGKIAAMLRKPLATPDLLAAQLLRGEVKAGDAIEGVDYRGEPVLGVMQPVPGTNWYLTAKIDRAELRSEAAADIVWVFLTGTLVLFIAGSGYYIARQRQELATSFSIRKAQTDRLQALSLLSAVAEASSDAIFAKDIDGRYILFNKAAADFVGKPVDQLLGKDDRAIFPPDEAEMLDETNRRVIAGNQVLTEEEVVTTRGGARVFLSTKGPLHDPEGKIVGTFGISRDVTEYKRAEQKLRSSEERLRLALLASSDGLWDWDVVHDHAYLSPRYYKICGYRPDQVEPKLAFLEHAVHPDDWPMVDQAIRATLDGTVSDLDFEARLVTASGALRWARWRGRVVERDASGVALRMVGTTTDITESKSIQEAIRIQAEQLAQRNTELERFNRAMVGRELDMIALKQRVNALSRELGREPPFAMDFVDASALTVLGNGAES